MNIDPYSPCICGSGNKFKFCCKNKVRDELDLQFKEYQKQGQDNIMKYEKEMESLGIKVFK